MNSTMTPYNEVSAFCLHELLKVHAIDLKGKVDSSKSILIGCECNEHIIHSEALFMAPGCNIYIVVTTKRVVLFDVRQEGSSGNKVILMDWQIAYNDHSIITSRLENKGHHGIGLCISQYAHSDKDNLADITIDEIADHDHLNNSLLNISEMYLHNIDLPQKGRRRCLRQKMVGFIYFLLLYLMLTLAY